MIVVAANSYDELYNLKLRKLGSTSTSAMATQLSEYNIQGWPKAINKAFLNTPTSTANWFVQERSYDFCSTNSEYDGNIAGERTKNGVMVSLGHTGYSYTLNNAIVSGDFKFRSRGYFSVSINWVGESDEEIQKFM
jgi:hypothetical protein